MAEITFTGASTSAVTENYVETVVTTKEKKLSDNEKIELLKDYKECCETNIVSV